MPIVEIDPATHGVCGLTGQVHKDYRSEVTVIEPLLGSLRRICCRLTDDVVKPAGSPRRPTLVVSVVAPEWLRDYSAYRVELCRRIERGGSLTDIALAF